MTLPAGVPRKQYTGNGATLIFSFPYYFLESTDLLVYRKVISTGVTSLVDVSEYTVSGAGAAEGGNVTFAVAPTSDHQLTVLREVTYKQDSDYVTGEGFPADDHEQAVDRIVMMAQQLNERYNRVLVLPVSILDSLSIDPTLPTPAANKSFAWDGDGTALIEVDNPQIASDAAVAAAAAASAAQAIAEAAETAADASATAAAASAATAVAAVASVSFPTLAPSTDPRKHLAVNSAGDGYELVNFFDRSASDVASATTPTFPGDSNYFRITGTTDVATLPTRRDGEVMLLVFSGILNVLQTGNIVLKNGAFVTAAESWLFLVYDATTTKWIELVRSPFASTSQLIEYNFTEANQASNSTAYYHPGNQAGSGSAFDCFPVFAMTSVKAIFETTNAPGASESFVATLLKNGSDTGLVVTIADAAKQASADAAVAYNEGDTLELKLVTSSGSNATGAFGLSLIMQLD